ncbi:hypothetical protein DIPPA_13794 [Diplonema papillatum]|nr:hypothetical protein DIPPA_13794 [Diplonema papillatum]
MTAVDKNESASVGTQGSTANLPYGSEDDHVQVVVEVAEAPNPLDVHEALDVNDGNDTGSVDGSVDTARTSTSVDCATSINVAELGAYGNPIRGEDRWKTNYFLLMMSITLLLNGLAAALILSLSENNAKIFENSTTMALVNLFLLTLWRNEFFLCGLFSVARMCKRERLHRLVHNYGGVHAAAGVSCLAWVVMSIVYGVVSDEITTTVLVLRIVIASLLLLVASAGSKKLRRKYHNQFEIVHRYTSWVLLAILAADIGVQIPEALDTPVPYLWLATLLLILSSWVTTTKERCNIRLLSPSNERILVVDMPDVKYRGAGLAMKLSRNGIEWHPFAVCPSFYSSGSMCVIAAAGDWTKELIQECVDGKAHEYIYTRSMFPGFMNSSNTFTNIACVATGAGIAPILATIYTPGISVKLLWVTNTKYDTSDITAFLDAQNTPHHIFNTAVCRPGVEDIMAQIPNEVEAIFIVSNPEFTRDMKKHCNQRNIRCFGANWDS